MKRRDWQDEDIKKMLRSMPKIEDKRSAAEVEQALQVKYRRKHRKQWKPLIVGIASLFLIIILSSTFLQNDRIENKEESLDSFSLSKMEESASSEEQTSIMKDNEITDITKQDPIENADVESFEKEPETDSTNIADVVYKEDVVDSTLLTIGIPDSQANYIIPVSIIVNGIMNQEEKLNELILQMNNVDEKSYGLTEYYPLDVKVSMNEETNTIEVDIPKESPLLLEDKLFLPSIKETFSRLGVKEIAFYTDGVLGAEFSHYGYIEKEPITLPTKRAYFAYQESAATPKLLVPSHLEYETIHEALTAAKTNPDDFVVAAIPDRIIWDEVKVSAENVVVSLSEEAKLQDTKEYLLGIEAMLLIAKNFGYKTVTFENSNIERIKGIDLTKEIPVPEAPNLISK